MGIKVTDCKTQQTRKFPCLLQGKHTRNYYYATSASAGFNLTVGVAEEVDKLHVPFDMLGTYTEVDCVTLKLD